MGFIRNRGRVVGLWYMLLVVLAPLRLVYIPSRLLVRNDATATVNNIAAHEWIFRMGMAGDLLCAITLVIVALAFYRLFRGVDASLAVLVVILGGVMPGLLYLVNVANDETALMIMRHPGFLAEFSRPQRDGLAMIFLRMHDYLNTAAEMLWGGWLFPLGVLVYRSRMLPRFLGIWLVLNGMAYVTMSLVGVLASNPQAKMFELFQPALLGEFALMLWLVVKGTKVQEPALLSAR